MCEKRSWLAALVEGVLSYVRLWSECHEADVHFGGSQIILEVYRAVQNGRGWQEGVLRGQGSRDFH